MLSCKQVSELASESIDRRLSLGERLRMGLHLALCGFCRRYRRQIRFLHEAAGRLGGDDMPVIRHLDEEARRRIADRIAAHRED